jgi:hypothetical protein
LISGRHYQLGHGAGFGIMAGSSANGGLRTALEGQSLQEELPGTKAYATQLRYHLLPRVW